MSEPASDWSTERIVAHLRSIGDEKNVESMGRFGIDTTTAIGISTSVLRPLARRLKRNHDRAEALWASNIREARLLAAFTDEPKKVTVTQTRQWADEFNSWDIVDTVSDLYGNAGLQAILIPEFAADEREFVRRMAFSMMAWSAVHMKKEADATFFAWLPLIETHAADPRNFVKKAVNWALRQIGKRNAACHGPALELAQKLAESSDRTERWIGKDAAKELLSEKVLKKVGLK